MHQTRVEFEVGEAMRLGIPRDRLGGQGYFSAPCTCDFPTCPGWLILKRDGTPPDVKAEDVKRFGEEEK